MAELAIIGGTGLARLSGMDIVRCEVVRTPFGEPSGPITHGYLFGHEVAFIPRHGSIHNIPPHRVNYRANLWALKHIGAQRIVAIAAVGGITGRMEPGHLVFPNQIIDYTWARAHTFFEEDLRQVTHIDFTEPYCESLRELMIYASEEARLAAVTEGTYGATQGPRLETAAEINRLERDGCNIVGMTGMPEAALARELELCYVTCAVISNWAAGRGNRKRITMAEVSANLEVGMAHVQHLLEVLIPQL